MFKLKLISDFRQSYDHQFDLDGYPFRRMSKEGPTRPEMFDLMKGAGIQTVLFGTYKNFVDWGYLANRYVVIYYNINAHCGEGKERKLFGSLTKQDKSCYLSEYIESATENYVAKSSRILCIGNKYTFTYDYISKDDWRSNCGEVDVTGPVEIPMPSWRQNIFYPLVAIDFVEGFPSLRAIDLNIAPGVSYLLEGIISPSKIVDSIREWYLDFNKQFISDSTGKIYEI